MISGHLAEHFIWTIGGLRFHLWIARDFPNADALNTLLDQLQNSGPAAATAALMPSRAALPGTRLRTEIEAEGRHISYTILSVQECPTTRPFLRSRAATKKCLLPSRRTLKLRNGSRQGA